MRTSPASALKHCDSSNPPQSPKHVFPNTSFALQLRSSWLEDLQIRGRCDGTNSSTEDVLARCAATAMETEYTGDTCRSIARTLTIPDYRACRVPRFSAVAGNPCVFKLSITLVVLAVDEEPPRSSIAILSGLLPWPKVGWSAASATVHLDATS